MARNWRRPKSDSLEEFVFFLFKAAWKFAWLLVFLAFAVYALRYAFDADVREAPWEWLPLVGAARSASSSSGIPISRLVTLIRMTCPKCQGEMRTYERNGINVDQCTECRGLFLDRGELEHLVQAEGSFYGGGGGEAAPRRQEHDDRDSYQYGGKQYRKRKKNFLEELFD